VLKTHFEHTAPELAPGVAWLDPIYLKDGPEALLRPYAGERIDVLGLSSYTWNWELQRRIARLVKAEHPGCLVVAGGPDPDYKDPRFFDENPAIDAIVVKDGEQPFSEILRARLAGDAGPEALRRVRGLFLPRRGSLAAEAEDKGGHVFTGEPEPLTRFDWSSYLEQSAFYEGLVRRHAEATLSAIWETNRGCPYRCTFCDWGSATMSKVRAFGQDRVREEAFWLARQGLQFVFLTDANFGILARDLEIADWINQAHDRHGSPRAMYYSPAKNNPERTVEIARRFARSGISAFHTLALQHTDDEVLACVERANIRPERQREVVAALLADGIPLDTHLILGMPGDTLDRWKRCLGTVMEWGIHQEYIVFPFGLLPNAPAAEPEYLAKWSIRSVERLVAQHQGLRSAGARDSVLRSRVVVATSSYSAEDWVAMRAYTAFVQAFHNCSLTRLPALYLRLSHGVPYESFYRGLIDEWCEQSERLRPLKRRIEECMRRFLADPEASDDVPVDDLPPEPVAVDPSRYVVLRVFDDLDAFFGDLYRFLRRRFPEAPALASALGYQKNLLIRPGDDPRRGRSFRVHHDWPRYLERAARIASGEPLAEPAALAFAAARVHDDFDLPRVPEAARKRAWFETTVLFRRAHARATFSKVELLGLLGDAGETRAAV